jgi:hypothetical protein
MAGYSQTPLARKLGIKEGFSLYIKDSPFDYGQLLGQMPNNIEVRSRLCKNLDFIHCFVKSQKVLSGFLPKAKNAINPNGMIWISWPKKASKVTTDVTEDVVRQVCLPMDLVDVKVCAIDDTWSGLKLVIRKQKRI